LALAVREMRRVGLTVIALVYWWDDRFEMCENPIGIGQAEEEFLKLKERLSRGIPAPL